MPILPERHGRWPLVAAAAVGPALVTVLARPEAFLAGGAWVRWLPLPALLVHQTEEWVWPGGFLPWINRDLLGSGADELPITRRDGLIINAGLGWGVAVTAGLAGERRPAIAAAQLSMDLGNAGLHLGAAARSRSYNPGSASAAALLLPLGAAGLYRLWRQRARRREIALGAAAGALSAAALMALMRGRVARASGRAGR